jgi:hypothetical protein
MASAQNAQGKMAKGLLQNVNVSTIFKTILKKIIFSIDFSKCLCYNGIRL